MKRPCGESALTTRNRAFSRQTRYERVLAAILFFLAIASVAYLACERDCERPTSSTNASSLNSGKAEFPFMRKALPFSNEGLVESSRSRPQGGERERLSRFERLGRCGVSFERRSTMTPAFHVCFDCYDVAPGVFLRFWIEKTSPRPIWLFLLTLLN